MNRWECVGNAFGMLCEFGWNRMGICKNGMGIGRTGRNAHGVGMGWNGLNASGIWLAFCGNMVRMARIWQEWCELME